MSVIQIPSPIGEGRILMEHALGSPALASATAIHAAVADNAATQVITPTAQPDVARCIVATPGGTTANVTAVSVSVTGVDAAGNTVTEVLPAFSAGAATAVTSLTAFRAITSISQPAIGTGVTVAYGTSPKLGLGVAGATVLAAYLNGVKEGTPPTVTPSATPGQNLVQLASALNGTPVRVDYY
jgi:hypothetical protein